MNNQDMVKREVNNLPDNDCIMRLEKILTINDTIKLTGVINRNYQQDIDYGRLGLTIGNDCQICPYRRIVETVSYCTNQTFLRDVEEVENMPVGFSVYSKDN